jgi:hypothetical protein
VLFVKACAPVCILCTLRVPPCASPPCVPAVTFSFLVPDTCTGTCLRTESLWRCTTWTTLSALWAWIGAFAWGLVSVSFHFPCARLLSAPPPSRHRQNHHHHHHRTHARHTQYTCTAHTHVTQYTCVSPPPPPPGLIVHIPSLLRSLCVRVPVGRPPHGRHGLVRIAQLLGSDYTPGVHGVGIVNATEILAAFPGACYARCGHVGHADG